MFAIATVAAVALALCSGGRLAGFEQAEIRWLPVPVAALPLQGMMRFFPPLVPVMVVSSYGLLFAFFLKNRRLRKTAVLGGAGCFLNALVIVANGFCMPVSQRAVSLLSEGARAQLLGGEIPMYCAAGAHTRLLFLGDVMFIPVPGVAGFASVGDVLLAAGLFFCILYAMAPPRLPRWLCGG